MGGVTRRDALTMAGLSLPMAAGLAVSAEPSSEGRYLILSCDGGGIRGLLTAKIIERLESEIPFLDRIDLFAGTSTGGIIALGLANQVAIGDLVNLYRTRCLQIFAQGEPKPPAQSTVKDWLDAMGDKVQSFLHNFGFDPSALIHPKYSNDGLKKVLTEVLGDGTLGTVKSGKSVMVTTFRLLSESLGWTPRVLHNVGVDNERGFKNTADDSPSRQTTLVDAGMCTSAAPLYFPPYRHPDLGYCVDGGLFANCPASIAMALALRVNKGSSENIRILSIGTGLQNHRIDIPNAKSFNDPSEYGPIAWLDPIARGPDMEGGVPLTPAFPIVNAMVDANTAANNYICAQTLGANRYHRVQANLPRPLATDAIDPASIAALEAAVDNIPASEWRATVDWVKKQFG